ncbi:MAG: anthranilate phosphoribosyltransferase [Alphaproteobacteria bacterium]|nr:anthranilate phosphoribosyltransferase [Alphaproteobacteria bacterium]
MSLPPTLTPLSEDQMIAAMNTIMNGESDDQAIEAFLRGLSKRGESVDEITGAARVMREKATSIQAPYTAVDCCGTGGDASGTYNISTAVAIVAAACGVPIAKHGNRASSSKSGAADVLEAMGVNLDISAERLEQAIKLYHFCFLMATNHHSAMKYVAPARKAIGARTIFNLLGPLANPAGTRHQLLGVYAKEWVMPMAETLKNLGTKSAWVVHGQDGLDEISISAPTDIAILREGKITQKTITPDDFGLKTHNLEKIKGGDADENASALRALLEGQKGAYRDIVLANTAAVLHIHGKTDDLKAGAKLAATEIDSGHAYQILKDYIAFTREEIEHE